MPRRLRALHDELGPDDRLLVWGYVVWRWLLHQVKVAHPMRRLLTGIVFWMAVLDPVVPHRGLMGDIAIFMVSYALSWTYTFMVYLYLGWGHSELSRGG